MNKPCVIVCERSSRWATAIRRHLPSDVRLVQTRGLAECASELALAPGSLAALEPARTNIADLLGLVGEISSRFPLARVVILGDRAWKPYEWLWREAGAVHFVVSPRELSGFGRTVRNHFDGLPVTQIDFAEAVWDTLPWRLRHGIAAR